MRNEVFCTYTGSEKNMKIQKITIDGKEYALAPVVSGNNLRAIEVKAFLEIYSQDLPEKMTYINAVKEVAKLGDGWRIPTLGELRLMYESRDNTFCVSGNGGSVFPDWYWSSTENRDDSSCVHVVRFSDGYEFWGHKDNGRLSCRPVRLVAAPSLG